MDPVRSETSTQKILASFIVILAVVLIAGGVSLFNKKQGSASGTNTSLNSSNPTSDNSASTNTTSPTSSSTTSNNSYKDGTYTASDDYVTPGGDEAIAVHLTIKNDTITAASIEQQPSNHDSLEYQADFLHGYKSHVVGKAISSLNVSNTSGASLTTRAFNAALEQIRSQAHA